jgi:magnesium chelatase family protein
LEEGEVALARSAGTLKFPARFQLIGALNPCPCGYFGDATRECRCTPSAIQRYLGKISGPLLDRIDLHVEVPAVPIKELRADDRGVTSAQIRERVAFAREAQAKRGVVNADVPGPQLRQLCQLDDAGERTLELAMRRMGLSARAHDRLLKVALTIADLDHSNNVRSKHLAEAIQYRSLDRTYWG